MQPRPDEGEPNPEHLYFSQHLPHDAEQMGLDRNTEEGAMIAMAGALRPARTFHRLVAWIVVLALTLPLLFTLLGLLL